MTPIIYFVRHGETDWNAEGRLQGQRDIPLNDLGRVQAEEVAGVLTRLNGRFEDLAYWASPLSRARETMELMRIRLGLAAKAYRTDDRLKEIAFGDWEGFTWSQVEQANPELAAARIADKWHVTPPSGENYEVVATRLHQFLGLVERDSVVVAHGGVGRALMALAGGLAKPAAAETYVRQGVIYVFEAGGFRVEEP
ncbi:histidine phosphatase family protein [Phreatobacter stygius]|uniref:Histidine phosphatase family protein n=1 Tax=Phreatobacter stygius TaxID=1940610 RepID=A0A4D7AVQ0_9HYPH|nr:histidine phosphatase family protein [Phreatobacter stygius]